MTANTIEEFETDDYSEPTFLEELIDVLEKNENTSLAFCVSNYVENDIIIYDSTRRTKDLNVEENTFKVISVSYTHLDVYKRQAQISPKIWAVACRCKDRQREQARTDCPRCRSTQRARS